VCHIDRAAPYRCTHILAFSELVFAFWFHAIDKCGGRCPIRAARRCEVRRAPKLWPFMRYEEKPVTHSSNYLKAFCALSHLPCLAGHSTRPLTPATRSNFRRTIEVIATLKGQRWESLLLLALKYYRLPLFEPAF